LVRHVDQFIDIAAHRRNHDPDKILPKLRSDFEHHAVVEQNDPRVGTDQNVSRMRIGVKEAVDQKLVAVKADQVLDHLLGIYVLPHDFIDFVDPKALEELHHQNARRSDFSVNARNDDEVAVAE